VPEIGDQSYIIGSNVVDFLHTPLVHRSLEELHVENSIYETKHQFDMIHDYRRNPNYTYKNLCKADGEEADDDNLDEQEASPGIIMMLEAENLSADLSSIGDVKTAVSSALKTVGFQILTGSALPPLERAYSETASNFAFILKEGYVVVRAFSENRHVSFDIHLWSAFGKHEAAKKALVASVGGKMDSVTSYRIVAGGMFGVSTWKEDVKSRGPKVTQKCEEPTAAEPPLSKTDTESTAVAIKAGVSLIQDKNAITTVLCGYETEPCNSIKLLEKDENIKEVVPLYTCPGLMADDQSFDDRQAGIFKCKESTVKALDASLAGEDRKLSAIVLDKSAPKVMGKILGQILFRIFRGQKGAPEGILSDQLLMLASVEEESEGWRRKLLNMVREKIIVADPIFGSRVFLNSSDSSIELHVTSSGDELFFEHLVEMVATVERENDLSLEIRNILGGYWRPEPRSIMEQWEASKYMSPDDYNRMSSLEQWKSQKPLGYQTVFQLEHARRFNVDDNVKGSYDEGESWLQARVIDVDYAKDMYTVLYVDGDTETLSGSNLKPLHGDESLPSITAAQIDNTLTEALSEVESQSMDNADVYSVENIGDGHVTMALWSGGTVVVVWDGRTHVDINLFTYDESVETADEFISHFKQFHGTLTTALRDEQPRGTGRVVNFLKDVSSTADPRWA